MQYGVMFEGDEQSGFSAYVPDLPGCVAAADTLAETRLLISEAIALHVEAMRQQGEVVPPPSHWELVEVAMQPAKP